MHAGRAPPPPATHTAPATPPAARLLQIWDHVRLRLSTSLCLRSAITGAFCRGGGREEQLLGCCRGELEAAAAAARRRRQAAAAAAPPPPAQAAVLPRSQPPRPVLACAGSRCSGKAALRSGRRPSSAHSRRPNPRADSSLVARLVLPQPQTP